MAEEANIKHFEVTEPYLDVHCSLGEGPFWEEENRCLRFVDIVKQQIHVVYPDKGPESHVVLKDLEYSIGHTINVEGDPDHFAYGGKAGFGLFDRQTGQYEYIAKYWHGESDQQLKEHEFRGNDGNTDAKGRYLMGIMNDPLVKEPGPNGMILTMDTDKTVRTLIENITCPNGINWDKSGTTLYVADSPTKKIHAYDYDIESGQISNKRLFFKVEEDEGVPDGQAVDEEGYMWSAVYGASKVIRISPEGKIDAEIKLPTRSITCPVFVDDWLYITSAEEEEPEKFPESVKYQGAVFRCQVGVRGLPQYTLKLDPS